MEGTGLKTIGRDNNRSIVGPAVRLYFGPDICYLTLYCHPLVHIVHSSTVTRPAYLSWLICIRPRP